MEVLKQLIKLVIHLSFANFTVKASYPIFGNCLQHAVIQDFNASQYAGTWFEFEKYYSFADYGVKCATVRYDTDHNFKQQGSVLRFTKRSLYGNSKITEETGVITTSETNMRRIGNMRGTLSIEKVQSENPSTLQQSEVDTYWILGTDYENYSVVWSCTNYGWMNFQSTTLLTRVRNPTNKIRGLAYGVMKSHGLMTKLLFQVGQDECPEDIFVIPDEPPSTTPLPQLITPSIRKNYSKSPSRVKQGTSRPKRNRTKYFYL